MTFEMTLEKHPMMAGSAYMSQLTTRNNRQ